MKFNVGGIDRVLRILAGAALVVGAATSMLPVWAWIGVVPLATGLVGFCPVYLPLGWSTAKKTQNP